MPLKIFTFLIGIFISIFLFLPFFTVASAVDISIVVANVAGIDDVVDNVGAVVIAGVESIVSTVLISNGVVVCGTFVVDSMDVNVVVDMCTARLADALNTYGTAISPLVVAVVHPAFNRRHVLVNTR